MSQLSHTYCSSPVEGQQLSPCTWSRSRGLCDRSVSIRFHRGRVPHHLTLTLVTPRIRLDYSKSARANLQPLITAGLWHEKSFGEHLVYQRVADRIPLQSPEPGQRVPFEATAEAKSPSCHLPDGTRVIKEERERSASPRASTKKPVTRQMAFLPQETAKGVIFTADSSYGLCQ
jgi:hypothetical protein